MATTLTRPRRAKESGSAYQPEIFRLTPLEDREEGRVEVHTSKAPLSAKEQRMLDELAMLFTIQEEQGLSEAGREKESSRMSKASLSPSSRMSADASFIYQHVNFQVLSKCMPGFVKTHLNRNGRYLPETFILRVNYWRRRRMIGDDSSLKRSKKEPVVRACAELAASASARGPLKTSRPHTVNNGRK
ncbi:hypothetical protein ACOMHN_053554 [Nucella lapillus]